jgi:uncharacterized membrane protein
MTETAPQPMPVKVRAPRWMWIALVLSLAVNLFVAGAAARALWHFRDAHGGPHPGPDGLSRYLRSLPADRRDEIASLIEAERAKSRALRRMAREKRRQAARAFEAEPFDAARLEAAAREASEARIALLRQREMLLSTLATKLTAEERRAYISSRRARHDRWRRWHHRREGSQDRDAIAPAR